MAGLHKVSKFKAPGVIRSEFDAEDPQILGSTANWHTACALLG